MEVRPQVYKEDDKKQLSIKVTLCYIKYPYFLSQSSFIFKFWFFPWLYLLIKVSQHLICLQFYMWLWKSSNVIFCVFKKPIKYQYFCWQKLHLNLKYLKHIKSKKRKSGKASEYFFAHFMTRTKYWEEIAIDCECSWKSHIWQWKLLDLLKRSEYSAKSWNGIMMDWTPGILWGKL